MDSVIIKQDHLEFQDILKAFDEKQNLFGIAFLDSEVLNASTHSVLVDIRKLKGQTVIDRELVSRSFTTSISLLLGREENCPLQKYRSYFPGEEDILRIDFLFSEQYPLENTRAVVEEFIQLIVQR